MSLPTGTILLWAGAILDIPTGWRLCDGGGGTPDLRDRFIVGSGLAFAPGDNGGAGSHVHGIEPDNATLDAGTFIINSDPAGAWSATTQNHSHGTQTDSADTKPPYYSLAYIMRI